MLTVGNWWVTLGKCLSTDCGLPFHSDSVCFPPFSAGIKLRASPTPPPLYSPYRVLLKSKGFNCDKVLFIDFFFYFIVPASCFAAENGFQILSEYFSPEHLWFLTLIFRLVPLVWGKEEGLGLVLFLFFSWLWVSAISSYFITIYKLGNLFLISPFVGTEFSYTYIHTRNMCVNLFLVFQSSSIKSTCLFL